MPDSPRESQKRRLAKIRPHGLVSPSALLPASRSACLTDVEMIARSVRGARSNQINYLAQELRRISGSVTRLHLKNTNLKGVHKPGSTPTSAKGWSS